MSGTRSLVRKRELIALIRREIEKPRPFEQIAEEIGSLLDKSEDVEDLGEVLKELAAADRRRFYVKSEGAWFRKFGFRLMRPMLTICLLAAVLYTIQSAVPPVLGLAHFLLGVAALYVVQQVYVHFWSRHDDEKLSEIDGTLRKRLGAALERLEERR